MYQGQTAAAPIVQSPDTTAGEVGRILVVDDDRSFGGFMLAALETRGHDVDWAGCVADALASLYSRRYDLVVIELRLPDGSGLEFLRDAMLQADSLTRAQVYALALDPESAVTLNNLAYLNLVQGNTAVALAYAERAKMAADMPMDMMLPDTIASAIDRTVEIAGEVATSEKMERQVAQTPALHAKGAGRPDARALSRMFASVNATRRVRPSSVQLSPSPHSVSSGTATHELR